MNHYFTADGLYTHSLPEGAGRIPRNARRTALPAEPWLKVWPRWNGKSWELVEDHRPRSGSHAQEGTPYWLPEDTEQTPARVMTAVGPLPQGALLTPPAALEANPEATPAS